MKKKHDKASTVTVDASCSLQEPPATFYVPSLKLDLCTKSETGLTGWEKMGLKPAQRQIPQLHGNPPPQNCVMVAHTLVSRKLQTGLAGPRK